MFHASTRTGTRIGYVVWSIAIRLSYLCILSGRGTVDAIIVAAVIDSLSIHENSTAVLQNRTWN